EEVVRQCLAKAPQGRPQSAAELADLYTRALGRPLVLVRRPTLPAGGGSKVTRILSTVRPPTAPGHNAPASASDRLTRTMETVADRHAVRHSVEASMPEAMAMVKLKGFIHDLGGEVVESVPGMIRVRVGEPRVTKEKAKGLLGWFSASKPTAVAQPTT